MEKQRSFKTMALLALVLSVFGVSVAFAAMSTSLEILGTAKMEPERWSVHFDGDLKETKSEGLTVTTPTMTGTTISTFDVTFTKPGEFVSYEFEVKNEGTMDAKLGTLGKKVPTCSSTADTADADIAIVCDTNRLSYTLTYASGTKTGDPVEQDDILGNGESVKMLLTLKFDGDKLPENSVTIGDLDIQLIYVQN